MGNQQTSQATPRVQYQQQTQATATGAESTSGQANPQSKPTYDTCEVAVLAEVISALVDKKGIEHFIKSIDKKRTPFEDRIKDCVMVAKAVAKQLRESA